MYYRYKITSERINTHGRGGVNMNDIIDNTDLSYYQLKLDYSQEMLYARFPLSESLKHNDSVVVPTRYGDDIARVMGYAHTISEEEKQKAITVLRIANTDDLLQRKDNRKKEEEALSIFGEHIKKHQLDMKPSACHYLLYEPKILFFFTADERVDFRLLVKDLVSIFKVRIELRQITVRDEVRMKNSFGSCGRRCCCQLFGESLKPVSVKMAKLQKISLNSGKVSGQCGRLLCCLEYEHNTYKTTNNIASVRSDYT